jgi:hypothetical protein
MKKSYWEDIKSNKGDLVLLDFAQLEALPIGKIASHPGILTATVSSTGEKVK